jgi:Mannosyltransferase (PIG-V)
MGTAARTRAPDGLRSRLAPTLVSLRWPVLVFLGSRALLLVLVWIEHLVRHQGLLDEMSTWDGRWYSVLALHGYPRHASHLESTLGFFPLYSIVIRIVGELLAFLGRPVSLVYDIFAAGVIVSTAGGLVATVLVQRLATGWWGDQAGRRAAVLFCLFPGSVIFSMVYGESLLIPLTAGCILALQHRRWVFAGSLAGLATATTPQGLVLIPVCAASAVVALRRDRAGALASLWAPALSVTGVAAFASFLWVWTGTPFASLQAQHYGWHERINPLALVGLAKLARTDIEAHAPVEYLFKPVVWLIGAVVLVALLVVVVRRRRSMSMAALIWTAGISFLAFTTEHVGPGPRMLITAFPALIAAVTCVRRRSFAYLAFGCAVLLLAASWVTLTVRDQVPSSGSAAAPAQSLPVIPLVPPTRRIMPP